jgi:hypothetical protein
MSLAVNLSDDTAAHIYSHMMGREYDTPEAVINAAVKSWQPYQSIPMQSFAYEQKLAALRADIAVGIKDIEEGRVSEWDVETFLTEVKSKRANHKKPL